MRFGNPAHHGGLVRFCLGAVVAFAIVPAAGAQPVNGGQPAVTTSFSADQWVARDEPIELRFDAPVAVRRLVVMVGQTDWTSLFDRTPTRLRFTPGPVALPAGAHELVLFTVDDSGAWQEFARLPIKVLTSGRFESADARPVIDITGKGQAASGFDGSAPPFPRERFHDFTVTGGGQFALARNGWASSGQVSVLGVTNREDALQFATRPADASLLDLSNYLVGARRGPMSVSLGHVSYGSQRHLATGFASRGGLATVRMGPRADVTVAGLNGSTIVGWNNFLGVQNRRHRIVAATVGIEAVPATPGALRLEVSGLDGSLLPQFGVNDRQVNDAEDSTGMGVRVVAAAPSNRFTLDAGYSRSRFGNPADPLLAQQFTLVPVRDETREARYLDARYVLVQRSGGRPSSLAVAYRHELIEPLFRSVLGDLRADVDQNAVELSATFGGVAAQVMHSRAHDNLEAIDSILRTYTRVTGVTAAVPLAPADRTWRPSITYQLNRTHQFGDALPVNSDFLSASQIPDQVSLNQVLGFEVQRSGFRAAYQFNRSFQDNRQPGRTLADLLNLTNTVSVMTQAGRALDFTIDVAFEGAENRELTQTDITRRVGVAANWRPLARTVLAGQLAVTTLHDDDRTRESRVADFNVQLSHTVPLWRGRAKPHAQGFVRYARQSTKLLETLLGTSDRGHFWTLNTGFTISLF